MKFFKHDKVLCHNKSKPINLLKAIFVLLMAIVICASIFVLPDNAINAEAVATRVSSCLVTATGHTVAGNAGTRTVNSNSYYTFTNTSFSDSVYVKYTNGVYMGGTYYDLYIYPRKVDSPSSNAWVMIRNSNDMVLMEDQTSLTNWKNSSNKYTWVCGEYKLVVKNSSGTAVNWTGYLGFGDIDCAEQNCEVVGYKSSQVTMKHIGSKTSTNMYPSGMWSGFADLKTKINNNSTALSGYSLYRGLIAEASSPKSYNEVAIYGVAKVPTSGITLIHASFAGHRGTKLNFFDDIPTSVTIDTPSYQILFDGKILRPHLLRKRLL